MELTVPLQRVNWPIYRAGESCLLITNQIIKKKSVIRTLNTEKKVISVNSMCC